MYQSQPKTLQSKDFARHKSKIAQRLSAAKIVCKWHHYRYDVTANHSLWRNDCACVLTAAAYDIRRRECELILWLRLNYSFAHCAVEVVARKRSLLSRLSVRITPRKPQPLPRDATGNRVCDVFIGKRLEPRLPSKWRLQMFTNFVFV